jgi:lipooligosaccharide transport system ATP-binding protein
MSTHYIEEAQRLADTVLIMSHGQAVARGKPSDLVLEYAGERGARGLRTAQAARRGRVRGECVRLKTRRTGTSVSVLGLDGSNGFKYEGERRQANLEDVFVLLTGEEIA